MESSEASTAPARAIAQYVYFHRRCTSGISFAEFERQLAALDHRWHETGVSSK